MEVVEGRMTFDVWATGIARKLATVASRPEAMRQLFPRFLAFATTARPTSSRQGFRLEALVVALPGQLRIDLGRSAPA